MEPNCLTDTPSELRLTKERHAKRHRLRKNGRRVRLLIDTPLGRATINDFLKPLTALLGLNLDATPLPPPNELEKPEPPPHDLGDLLRQLSRKELAFTVLVCLLDALYIGWKKDKDPRAILRPLCDRIGKNLHDRLALKKLFELHPGLRKNNMVHEDERLAIEAKKHPRKFVEPDWSPRHCVKAGEWALRQALALSCFTEVTPKEPLPKIKPEWQEDIDRTRTEILQRDWVYKPLKSAPPDWTQWKMEFTNRPRVRFARRSRGKQKEAMEAAFKSGDFEHARGVSALQRVPLRVNEAMIPVVERYAFELMRPAERRKPRSVEPVLSEDIRLAREFSGEPFWLNYNCDFRGRLNPLSYFNFARRDYVRSLFLFENGAKLGPDGLDWLQVHVANCQGSTDKKPWAARVEWTNKHLDKIEAIARDPIGTFELWGDKDKELKVENPFQFVAACIELTAALDDPENFETRLPIGFDASCNGIQHLSLLSGDLEAGKLVNLTNTDEPQDIYLAVAKNVRTKILTSSDNWAKWWGKNFPWKDDRKIRKLVKQPVMTFSYGVTAGGMEDQIIQYMEMTKSSRLTDDELEAVEYLQKQVKKECEKLLVGPTEVMQYINIVASHCARNGRSLTWTSPTGFHVDNFYNKKARAETLYCGVHRLKNCDGYLPGLDGRAAGNGAAPNFVHSLDAAHLIRSVNAAVDRGITDILTVHDCFYCLAPYAVEFGKIVRTQLSLMHITHDGLVRLYRDNVLDEDPAVFFLPPNSPPAYGKLDRYEVQRAEWAIA